MHFASHTLSTNRQILIQSKRSRQVPLLSTRTNRDYRKKQHNNVRNTDTFTNLGEFGKRNAEGGRAHTLKQFNVMLSTQTTLNHHRAESNMTVATGLEPKRLEPKWLRTLTN